MQSQATTVDAYLAELPEDRRRAIETVRQLIQSNRDQDYEEGMQYGMISYFVPHRLYPAGYHADPRQPLPFICLASQKNHMSLYLSCTYASEPEAEWFRSEWKKTGKKLDMGKSCIRFKKVDDLALDLIATVIRQTPVRRHIEIYESLLAATKGGATRSVERPSPTVTKKKTVATRKKVIPRKKPQQD